MIVRLRMLCICYLFKMYLCYRVDQYTKYVGHPSTHDDSSVAGTDRHGYHFWQVCHLCRGCLSLGCLKLWLINVWLRKRAGRWRASCLHAAWCPLASSWLLSPPTCVCPLPRVVKEEISDDNAKLPCFNGRVVSWVSEMDAALLYGS